MTTPQFITDIITKFKALPSWPTGADIFYPDASDTQAEPFATISGSTAPRKLAAGLGAFTSGTASIILHIIGGSDDAEDLASKLCAEAEGSEVGMLISDATHDLASEPSISEVDGRTATSIEITFSYGFQE